MGKEHVHFNVCLGNPPYQQETAEEFGNNRQKPSKSVFQLFQEAANQITTEGSVLIYPGKRWMHQSGKGMKEFGLLQVNDPNLARVDFYPVAQDVFPTTGINDGITIVTIKKSKTDSGFDYHYIKDGSEKVIRQENPGEELLVLNPDDAAVMTKIVKGIKENGLGILHDRVMSRSLFGVESDFVEKNPIVVRLLKEGERINYPEEVKLLVNDKAGSAGRTKWFVTDSTNIPKNRDLISQWQVVVISANPGGQRRDNQLQIIDNQSAFGRSKVALGSFKDKQEAENFFKYCQTYLVRYALLMTDENLTSLAKKVPDFNVYLNSDLIDFNTNLDNLNEQLFDFFGLDSTERVYVKEIIDEKDRRKNKDE